MESHWIKIVLTVFGALLAVGGAVSACLQARWVREQRKTLREILVMLHAMRGDDIKKGIASNPVTLTPEAQGLSHDTYEGPTVQAMIV